MPEDTVLDTTPRDGADPRDEAFFRLLARNVSGQRESACLLLGGEPVCFPHRGSIAGLYLLHRVGAECRYVFSPREIGPFFTTMDGLDEIDEIRPGRYYPCPFCFAGTPVMDDLEIADAARVNELRRVLRRGEWRRDFYKGFDSYDKARQATLPDEPTPVIVKNGVRLNVPADDTVDFRHVNFTFQPTRMLCQVRLVTPVPLDLSAGLELRHELRIVCRTVGRFVRDVTLLDGRELVSCGRLYPWESFKGEGCGSILRFELRGWQLLHRPLRGDYTIDAAFKGRFMTGEKAEYHLKGRIRPTKEFKPLK